MIEEITAKLYDLAEEDYRVFNSRLLPGASRVLGVRLPEMRKLAKETAKGDFRAYLEEAQRKITADSIHEEIMVQGLVIGYAKMEKKEYRKYLDEFVPKISNWSVCDSCVSGFKFMRTDPEYWFAYLKTYRESKEEFELRFMIVAMLDYFVDEEHIDEILSICDKIRHNGYYVKMAVAWIIQVCYVKFPEKTRRLLENNSMDDFTHNKAIQKIRESYQVSREEKEELNRLKRK